MKRCPHNYLFWCPTCGDTPNPPPRFCPMCKAATTQYKPGGDDECWEAHCKSCDIGWTLCLDGCVARQDYSDLREIVKKLADHDPEVSRAQEFSCDACCFCGEVLTRHVGRPDAPEGTRDWFSYATGHANDCLWLRAQKLIYPESKDGGK